MFRAAAGLACTENRVTENTIYLHPCSYRNIALKQGRKHIAFILLVAMATHWGCSTEKNKGINRGYHNMTSRYNGYFNANEIIRESLKTYRDAYKEDYTKILPIYVYADEKTASTLYPNMDKAISKTSVVIDKHSMPNPKKSGKKDKKEEWCKWIDNNWLVMGQAHFYKREFSAAREKFEYVRNTYKNLETKYDARLWLAKTWLEEGNMQEAEKELNKLQDAKEEAVEAKEGKKTAKKEEPEPKKKPTNKKKSKSSKKKKKTPVKEEEEEVLFPEYLHKDLAVLQADFYIRNAKYEKAIDKLEESIKLAKKKREKARLTFILAQVHQKTGNLAVASDTYGRVLKLNPTFEMEFYSKINRALLFQGGDSRGIRAELMKLLRDEKNKEFFDQIYYALAELEFKEEDKDEAVNYLNKSIEASITNDRQKGKSYLRLADLRFGERNYVPAKAYYDSSLAVLPKDYQDYVKIQEKSKSLTELVTHLNTIALEDSLMRLSKMSEKELDKYLENLIKKEQEDAERKRLAEEERLARIKEAESKQNNSDNSWYFYNPQTMAFGNSQFKKIWGARKLEDDWRRSNKESFNEVEAEVTGNDSLASNEQAMLEKKKEAYKKKIPHGPEQVSASKRKVHDALYFSGVIFKDRLNQKDLAAKQFKELLKRYEEGEYVLPSKFQMYLLTDGNSEQEVYKKDILENHGDSEYAELIRNPNYKREDEAAKLNDGRNYAQVFDLYKKKDFENTLTACHDVITNQPKNHYLPQYYFLRAMSFGEMRQMESFEKALSECAEKFPKDETGKQAAEILDYIRNKKSVENAMSGGTYVYESEAEHFFILLFPNTMGSINDAKAKFSDFNTAFFSAKGLKVTNNFLDTDNQLIIIKSLENKQKAMEYYQAFLNENDKMKNLKSAEYFVITAKNYASFFVEKKVADYKKFFQENYLK